MASDTGKQITIGLHEFERVMESDDRGGDSKSTALACILLTILVTDALLVLTSNSPVSGALASLFLRYHFENLIPLFVLLLQAVLYYFGRRFLLKSTLSTILESRPQSILTFGLGSWTSAQRSPLIQRLSVFVGLLCLIGYLFFLLPPLSPDTSKAGKYAFEALRVLTPPSIAWLGAVLLFRCRIDRSVAVGIASAGALMVLASVAGAGGATDPGSSPIQRIAAVDSAWFSLAELFLVWIVLVTFWMVMVSNNYHRHIYKLVGAGVEQAPPVVQSTPFARIDRTPRFLVFQLGEAKILALTRLRDAEAYELVNTMDEHLILPIHDRSIKFWNINVLESRIPRRIQCLDPQAYFQLNVTLGTLTAASISNARRAVIGKQAVDFATENIFMNRDLQGILTRATGDAFAMYSRNQVDELDEIARVLDAAPSRTTVPFTDNQFQSGDELTAVVARIAGLQVAVTTYLSRLDQARVRFTETRNKLTDWHNPAGPGASQQSTSSAAASLEDIWYQQILRQFHRNSDAVAELAGVDGEKWHRETRNVLGVLGLRFNEVNIQLVGKALVIEERIKQTRSLMDELLRQYETQYNEAIVRRTAWKQGLVEQMVGLPGAVNARTAREVLLGVMSGAGTTTTPLGSASNNLAQQALTDNVQTPNNADMHLNGQSTGNSQNNQPHESIPVQQSRTDDTDLV